MPLALSAPTLCAEFTIQHNAEQVMAEQQSYWQEDDKSTIGKVFLMVAVFAGVMAAVAIGVSFVL